MDIDKSLTVIKLNIKVMVLESCSSLQTVDTDSASEKEQPNKKLRHANEPKCVISTSNFQPWTFFFRKGVKIVFDQFLQNG